MPQKIIDTEGETPQDHYEVLDGYLTDLLDAAGVEVEGEVLKHLLVYNRRLRIALGLPVEVGV